MQVVKAEPPLDASRSILHNLNMSTVVPPPLVASPLGVYYRRADHPGFFCRLLVDLIDLTVVMLLMLLIMFLIALLCPSDWYTGLAMLFTAALWFIYFVLLKRSRIRTLGYVLFGTRIVSLHGQPPSLFAMSIRLLFAGLGPFNSLLDLIWIAGDEQRQALRDKFAGTYVIRRYATPCGQGPIVYNRYMLLGYNFLFRDVKPAAQT